MQKAWNAEEQFFAQSYEDQDVLDSALLIMPLVFFMTPVQLPFICIICCSSWRSSRILAS